jgi:conjugative coupling factor TraD (SXT/TOL subfamily)
LNNKNEKQMKKRPLEALLRHPVEWYSSIACALAVLTWCVWPSVFLLTPALAYGLSGFVMTLGLKRFMEGYSVLRYRKNLRRLPYYALSSCQIPTRHQTLFLGKGFRWQPVHTQRLYACQQKGAEKYLKSLKLNRLKTLPDVGGNPILHGVELHEQDVQMKLSERVGHTLVLGTTRVGKTRLLEILVAQDIHRGDVVIVFDPKGDADLLKRIYFEAARCDRLEDFIIFHLGFPNDSARYNPVGDFARITEVANRIANQLPGSGESAAFREFAWRFVNIIAQALVALGRKPDYKQIQRYILDIDTLLLDYCKIWLPSVDPHWENAVKSIEQTINERNLASHLRTRSRYLIAMVNYIERNHLYDPIAQGLCSAFNYDKTYFDKITASLLPLLEKLTTGRVAELISPDYLDLTDKRPIFDWMQVIRGKKIVYVGLDALSDTTVAGAVGNSMFADLCSVAGQLYKYGVSSEMNQGEKQLHSVCVHCDEFNELIGDEFIPLLNKAGGAGFQVTAYTQTWSDVAARLQSTAKAEQVGGNLNTVICLRVVDPQTAKWFTDKLPQHVMLHDVIPASSSGDTPHVGSQSDFSSHNEDRLTSSVVALLAPSNLMQLPKGQAFCLLSGNHLWKIRMPLPKDDMSAVPDTLKEMVHLMQKT